MLVQVDVGVRQSNEKRVALAAPRLAEGGRLADFVMRCIEPAL
jgi:hypothetical protein